MNSSSPQQEDLFFFFLISFKKKFFNFIKSHRHGMATYLPQIASPESSSCSAGQ